MENINFSVKCCLLAFNIVALGPVVSLEPFLRIAYVPSYHSIIFTHVHFFFGDSVALLRES